MKTKEAGRVLFKTLFGQVDEISPDELRAYMAEHDPEEYVLLDVRQPSEYQGEHLPGAKLIPIAELAGRLDELDPAKPTFAY